ncbi:CHAT domain-containing protein [Saprospira sp. CCB-QB6]|uniref:CHAT domain-containing protein n=1 Tax=Saprospira sp. CCB-QB6 TaxID=3023936 RepID=UPI002348FC83|nr:CHAT domain-containing tetratricopeptide repeat protein [Saprospira sp. CCB-QB6]WCL82621.1 CHAT domain-containing protein [Saprospira sp. CCB-QB6]
MRPPHYFFTFLLFFCPLLLFGQDSAKYQAFENRFMEAYSNGQYDESIQIIDSALAELALYKEASLGWKDSLSWSFVGSKIVLQYNLGHYKEAQMALMKTKAQVQRLDQGKKGVHLAEWLGLRAKLYLAENNFEQTLSTQFEAKAIWEELKLEHSASYIALINNIAVVYVKLAQYAPAADFFRQSIALERKYNGTKGEPYARSLHNLMTTEMKAKRYAEAEQTANLILNIMEGLERKNAFYLEVLVKKGKILEEKKAYKEAEALYLKAMPLAKGNDVSKISVVMGLNYKMQQRYEEAENYYKQALAQSTGTFTTRIYFLLYLLYLEQEQYQKAEDCLEKYMTRIIAVFGKNSVKYAENLSFVAQLAIAKGELAAAEAAILEHFTLNSTETKSFSLDQLEEVEINYFLDLVELSRILFLAKDLESKRYEQTKNRQHLKRLYIIDSLYAESLAKQRESYNLEQDRLNSLKISSAAYQRQMNWAHLDQQAVAKLLAISEKDKSTLLLESQNERIAYSKKLLPEIEQEKQQAIKKRYSQLLKEYKLAKDKTPKDSLLALLNDQIWEMGEHKRHLFKQYPDYVDYKFGHKALNLSELQKTLGPNRAAIEYFLTDSSCFVFYLDTKELRYIEQKLNAETLGQSVMEYQRMLLSYKTILNGGEEVFVDYSQKAHQLYQLLLEPVLQEIPANIQQLLIIPDKELAYIPFETLLMQAAQKSDNYNSLPYLIKKYAVSYSFSLELWQHNQTTSFHQNNGQMLAMAAFYKEGDTISIDNKRSRLSPLKSAESEVRLLAKLFEGRFFYKKEASEERFTQEAKTYRFIHLAMHGMMHKEQPSLSGLAFTPYSDSLKDGFLQAIEIANLDLNADLVVLSACETGYGKFQQGNGTASLATAFIEAGVPALVVSLWQVDDAATAAIMQAFYQELEAGASKSAALRQAKLSYLANNKGPIAHPAFWSPFILMGNDKKLNLPPANPFLPFAIGGIMLSAGGAFFLRQKRKNRRKEKAA